MFTLKSGAYSACFTDFGCTLVRFSVPEGNGASRDIVLGYDSAEGYEAGSSFIGATVGRYAGRIGGAAFSIDGKRYVLPANEGRNHLHGGFAKRFFEVRQTEGKLLFSLLSPAGDEGFPGELRLTVTVTLENGRLRMEYEAVTDAPTHANVTNHAYFNLCGENVIGHTLCINGSRFAQTDEELIPTGRLVDVCGTPLDFTKPRAIEPALAAPCLARTRGLDHSFIIDGEGLRTAARLSCPESGIALTCRTTQPTLHVYTAGFLDEDNFGIGKGGEKLKRFGGVCLEAQHMPDAPNHAEFASTLVTPEKPLHEVAEYEAMIMR